MASSVETFQQRKRGKQVATRTERTGGIRVDDVEVATIVCQDAFNAGDLEGLVSLYETEAVLVAEPGRTTVGVDAIRKSLGGFLATNGTLEITTKSLEQAGGLALETYQWKLDATDAQGNPLTMGGPGAVVHRRQPDGRWLAVIDNPFA